MTDEEKLSQKNYRMMLKRNHFCRNCLKQDAYTLSGKVYCFECSEKRKKARHTTSARKADAERQKVKRQRRREEHLCLRCGKPLDPNDNHVNCINCRKKYRPISQKSKLKRYALLGINYPRGENGKCWLCNKSNAMDGSRLCRDCYNKTNANAAVARMHISSNHIWKRLNKNIGGKHART